MLREVGLGMIFLTCSAIGVAAAREMKKRLQSLYDLQEAMLMLQGEIRYTGATLPEAFQHVALHSAHSCSSFFESAGKMMDQLNHKSAKEAIACCAEKQLKSQGLKKEDLERLYRMGDQLGYLDQEMQIKGIEFYIEQQKSACRDAEKEYREKERIYHCLGIVGGLFLVILLA
ncbi:MAG: stage III sporulation protein AB [Eubacteriales bacterium]|nr:stage III sporulation protein AB [Eubacteriales bacterium]